MAWSAARVSILKPAEADTVLSEAVVRLQAELASAGFEAVIVTPTAGADVRTELERTGAGPIPAATLALSRVAGVAAIDVWVTDRVSGKTSVRRIDAVASSDMVPSALAIRAVDLLRASLLETTLPGRPAAKELTQLLPVRPPERGPLEGTSVGVALGVLHSFAGLGPAPVPVVQVARGLTRRFALRLELAGPAFGANVTASAGSASVRQELATLGLQAVLMSGSVVPYLTVAGGAYHLRAVGEAAFPHASRSGDVWAAAAEFGGGAALRMGSRVALRAELAALFTLPGAAVDLGGLASARAGRPSVLASAGSSWTF